MVNLISVQENYQNIALPFIKLVNGEVYSIPFSTLNDCREIGDQIHFGMKYWCFDSVRK